MCTVNNVFHALFINLYKSSIALISTMTMKLNLHLNLLIDREKNWLCVTKSAKKPTKKYSKNKKKEIEEKKVEKGSGDNSE